MSIRKIPCVRDVSQVNVNGLIGPRNSNPLDGPPDRHEVDLSKEYLQRAARRSKPNRNFTSYSVKHWAEHACGRYISNGAMITAAIELGIDVVPDVPGGINAYFNLDFPGEPRGNRR